MWQHIKSSPFLSHLTCVNIMACSIHIRSSQRVCHDWDPCLFSYFKISGSFSRYLYYIVLPLRGATHDTSLLFSFFIRDILIVHYCKRLFGRCILMPCVAVPMCGPQFMYPTFREADPFYNSSIPWHKSLQPSSPCEISLCPCDASP